MKSKLCVLGFLLVPIMALAVLDNEIDWRYGRQGVGVVTNAPSRAMHTALSNRVGETEDAVANYGPRLLFLENNAITSAPPQLVTSVNGQTGDVVIAEQDLSEYVRKDGGYVVDYPSFYLSGSHPKTLPAMSQYSFTFQPSGLMFAWYGGFSSRYTRMDDTGFHAEKTDDGVIIDWAHYGANGIESPRGTFLLPDNDGGTLATLDDMPLPTPLPDGIITNHAESVSFGSIELGGVTRGAWPSYPANAAGGWLMYDDGSNKWLRVVASNYVFTVWEVEE